MSYIVKQSGYYEEKEEWITEYIPFLRKAFIEKEWNGDPYKDPDEGKSSAIKYYEDLKRFLIKREEVVEGLHEVYEYSFDALSDPYGIKVTNKENDEFFYLKSDQFGFSSPSKKGTHPYDSYILNSNCSDEAIRNVADWIFNCRSLGGAFLWPMEKRKDGKWNCNPVYNTLRGGSSTRRGPGYIEDRVDLTLLEIKSFFDGKQDSILSNQCKEGSNMRRWLSHFKRYEKFIEFFCFDEFVNKHNGYIPYDIIYSDFSSGNKKVVDLKTNTERQIYSKENPLNNDDMKRMLQNVSILINERTKKMIDKLT